VILVVLLRSLLLPVLLVVTVALDHLAAPGTAGLRFAHGFGFSGTDACVPLYGFVFGGVITSAGVVPAAAFAALVVIPPPAFLAQIAFIVAFGVLLDTVVVRSLPVPALVRDIGPAVRWPGRPARGAANAGRAAVTARTGRPPWAGSAGARTAAGWSAVRPGPGAGGGGCSAVRRLPAAPGRAVPWPPGRPSPRAVPASGRQGDRRDPATAPGPVVLGRRASPEEARDRPPEESWLLGTPARGRPRASRAPARATCRPFRAPSFTPPAFSRWLTVRQCGVRGI
jgi:hypothetical protein